MIGRIERVPLRQVWRREARDFTTWLFENIEVLAEELDINLNAVEKERAIGSFTADIVAEDESGQKVLIENQLEKTDHDHLGKILTYVSNLDAKVAIWVSSEPRPEHERAIEWLNESGTGIDFYLVKIEAYRIENSPPAAKFSVIAGPSEKAVVVGEEKKELAERHKKRLAFWSSLLEKSREKTRLHSNLRPTMAGGLGTSAGKSGLGYNYVITYKYGSVEFQIDRGKGSTEGNKLIFDKLHEHRKEIEQAFGGRLEWRRLDDRRVSKIAKVYDYAGLDDEDKWDQLQNDMIEGMISLDKALKKHIRTLKL